MASLSARNHNPPIKAFYERLISKGKPKKNSTYRLHEKVINNS